MCIAMPGRIISITEPHAASVDFGDATWEVDLVMTPYATVGDYVIVHSGFAIRTVPADRAIETRRLLGAEHRDHLSSIADANASSDA